MSMSDDGAATLTNRSSMLALGLPEGATSEGTVPVQQQNRSLASRKWTVTDVSVKAVDVVVSTSTRCVASKVYVMVAVRNIDTVPAEVAITTPYGNKTVTVHAGKTVTTSFSTRKVAIASGSVTVVAVASGRPTATISAPLGAASCKWFSMAT